MTKFFNYLGQVRLYTFADLVELLLVAGAMGNPLWGALLLHVSFLAFLESKHKHEGREPVPSAMTWILFGLAWERCPSPTAAELYLFFSVMYALKKQGWWGLVSPFARAAQTMCMLWPFLHFHSRFLWMAAVAMFVRNIFGDGRDVEQDRAEGLKTWPVVLGLKHDKVFLHLFGVLATTWLWWLFWRMTWYVPLAINLIQVATYWFTPRPSNKKAAEWLRNKILPVFRR